MVLNHQKKSDVNFKAAIAVLGMLQLRIVIQNAVRIYVIGFTIGHVT